MLMNAVYDLDEWKVVQEQLKAGVISECNGTSGVFSKEGVLSGKEHVILVSNCIRKLEGNHGIFPLGCDDGFEFVGVIFNKELKDVYIDYDDGLHPCPDGYEGYEHVTWAELKFDDNVDLTKVSMYGAYVKQILSKEVMHIVKCRWNEYSDGSKDPVELVEVIL